MRYEPPARINFTLSNVTFHLLIMHSGHKLSHVRSKFMVDTRIFRCFEGREFFFHLLFFSHVLCDSLSSNVCIYVCKYTCMEAYVHHACMHHHVSMYVCVCVCIRKYNSSDLSKSLLQFISPRQMFILKVFAFFLTLLSIYVSVVLSVKQVVCDLI